MKTSLPIELLATANGKEADTILRNCVHCGFCGATCPTYQLLGDELDSPRGRIYLIKEALEGSKITTETQLHLDRCLSCLSCETTCPSGVDYGRLLDIGRQHVDAQLGNRKPLERLQRWLLRKVIPYPRRFAALIQLGRLFKPVMPSSLASKVPQIRTQQLLNTIHSKEVLPDRKVILFSGCAQSVVTPVTNIAIERIINRLGIEVLAVHNEGCCGAVSQHLNVAAEARQQMRRNIDAWWPAIEAGAEAIVFSASGCGLHIKEYAKLLESDDNYQKKSLKVSKIAKDVSEFLAQEDLRNIIEPNGKNIAFHSPCTLQHGLQLNGVVEKLLTSTGFTLTDVKDSHLCCGSAGTYSILQPKLSKKLQHNKIRRLAANDPDIIATANIGCQMHLQSVTKLPIVHWVEILANHMSNQSGSGSQDGS